MKGTYSSIVGTLSRLDRKLLSVYSALVFLSFHWSFVVYLNSSLLISLTSEKTANLLFMLGSILLFFGFIYLSPLLRRFGNFKLTILFSVCEIAALLGMALTENASLAIVFFCIHFVIVPLLFFNLDIIIEALLGPQEQKTGGVRGLYLSLLSFAAAIAPLFAGLLIGEGSDFTPAYITSALFVIPFMLFVLFSFKNFKDPVYLPLNLRSLARILASNRPVRNVSITHLLLQLFFTWTVIYFPLYLHTEVGFRWNEIGYIMSVALLAYVIFEYPIGVIADKYTGEKEMMALGFLVLALSVGSFAFLTSAGIVAWMIAMFISRIGASLAEVTTESYFFKHTKSSDTDKISLFRMLKPLGSILGAMVGSYLFLNMSFEYVFLGFALLMLPGIFFSLILKDTR